MNNPVNENTGSENSSLPLSEKNFINKPDNDINLNGSWEKKNRSITAAAFAGLIGIGVIYFNVQSILASLLIFVYQIIYKVNISGGFLERINEATVKFKTPILIALVISQYLFMLLPTLLIVKKWHTTDVKKYLRIKRSSINEILLAVLITITMLPFCYYFSYSLIDWLDIPDVIQNLGNQLFTADSAAEFLVLAFVVAVTPAICEEVFFRGYVQRTMERNWGMKSFIITGILFGLFHFQPLGLITLSILGVLFSFFFYRSKSLLPSSAAHFTNNFIALILLYSQSYYAEIFSEGNIPVLYVLLSTIISAFLVFIYIKLTSGNFVNNIEQLN